MTCLKNSKPITNKYVISCTHLYGINTGQYLQILNTNVIYNAIGPRGCIPHGMYPLLDVSLMGWVSWNVSSTDLSLCDVSVIHESFARDVFIHVTLLGSYLKTFKTALK